MLKAILTFFFVVPVHGFAYSACSAKTATTAFLLSFHTNQKHKMHHFKSSRGKTHQTHWVFHMANLSAFLGVGKLQPQMEKSNRKVISSHP